MMGKIFGLVYYDFLKGLIDCQKAPHNTVSIKTLQNYILLKFTFLKLCKTVIPRKINQKKLLFRINSFESCITFRFSLNIKKFQTSLK